MCGAANGVFRRRFGGWGRAGLLPRDDGPDGGPDGGGVVWCGVPRRGGGWDGFKTPEPETA